MTSNTHIHDRSLSWFDTDISIKRGGVKLSNKPNPNPDPNPNPKL